MNIVDKRLDELTPYENNPRINDNAVEPLVNSIREFGFKVPIVIDSNGVIVAGHTRYKAAQELGLETVPCIIADDLTDEQIKAFRLVDNKTGELATWDEEKLKIEIFDLQTFPLVTFGFEDFRETSAAERQQIPESEEIDIEDFSDDKFECECPKCGFKFNHKDMKNV